VAKQEGLVNGEYNDVISDIDVMKRLEKSIECLQIQFSKLTIFPALAVTVT
jgi:hypothetical protein